MTHLIDNEFWLRIAMAAEDFVSQYLRVGGTTVHSKIIAIGTKNGVNDSGIKMHVCPGTAHDEDIGIDIPSVKVVPRDIRRNLHAQRS